MPEVRGAICHRFELPELSEGAKFPALNLRIQAPSTKKKLLGVKIVPPPPHHPAVFHNSLQTRLPIGQSGLRYRNVPPHQVRPTPLEPSSRLDVL